MACSGKQRFFFAVAIVVTMQMWGSSVRADELKVMAIGAVAPLLRQIIPDFEKQYGVHVAATYGPTAALADKMSSGEKVDVIFGSPPTWERLVKEGKIEPGVAIARFGMGVGIRKGLTKPDISTGDALRRAMLEAKSLGGLSVGVGFSTQKAIKELNISDQVKSKYHLYPNGASLLHAMAEGEVDMGFSVVADMASSKEVDYVGPFPADVQKYTTVRAALAVGTPNSDTAQKLIAFVDRPGRSQQFKALWLEPLF